MVTGLPPQYIFMLLCCYKPDCPHPVCQQGKPLAPLMWYPGGPSITKLPLPRVDPDRLWGGECQSCTGTCYGHYVSDLVDVTCTDKTALSLTSPPPSSILKKEFSRAQGRIDSEEFIRDAAKQSLLAPSDTKIWIQHLNTVLRNRKRGAAKAAATRARKRAAAVQSGQCS